MSHAYVTLQRHPILARFVSATGADAVSPRRDLFKPLSLGTSVRAFSLIHRLTPPDPELRIGLVPHRDTGAELDLRSPADPTRPRLGLSGALLFLIYYLAMVEHRESPTSPRPRGIFDDIPRDW